VADQQVLQLDYVVVMLAVFVDTYTTELQVAEQALAV
jgi:hypothetical protein